MDIYKKYAKELMDREISYPCFCTDEELTAKREAAMAAGAVPQYDGKCRKLSKQEVAEKIAAGQSHTVRFKAVVKDYKLQDAIRGEVVFPANMVGDFVLLRSSGMPVYNFCCVVDDHLMHITHVIRAEEHLSNTVRQMMIYEAFSWPLPTFAHCSLILGSDRSKLSKRHGATSVNQYAEEGFLPETMKNFLTLLGWSSPEGKEVMPMEEIIEKYDLDRINKAPSVFDPVKLKWMNNQYIKALPIADITNRVIPFLKKAGIDADKLDRAWLEKVIELVRPSMEILSDAPKALDLFFKQEIEIEEAAKPVIADAGFKTVANALVEGLRAHVGSNGDSITGEQFIAIQDAVKTKTGAKGKGLFMPVRVCLTGQTHGPELKLVVPLFGAKKALDRAEKALGF